MSYKTKIIVIILALSGGSAFAGDSFKYSDSAKPNYAKLLGWVASCEKNNICGGHYLDPKEIASITNPDLYRDAPVKIKASKPAFITKTGISTVEGDVVLTQPGRRASADKVSFFRDDKTHKITTSILEGNVTFREHSKLVVAKYGEVDFIKRIYTLKDAIYRFLANTPTEITNVWGRAEKAVIDKPGVLKLDKATYSSCPPNATPWWLRGSKVTLDRNTGWGDATNAVVFIKKVPVFYVPYISFPIDDRRKSGFLNPSPSYSESSGYGFDVPYYFNLAPNYDAIFSPRYFTKRGVLLQGNYRYLTTTSSGIANLKYIPYDQEFVNFRDSATVSDPVDFRTLDSLKNSNSWRGFFGLEHKSSFNEHWNSSLDINYVTDDYFIQDFSNFDTSVDNDQLLNQADINYVSDHWNFLGRLQVFQTLHLITQGHSSDQYKKLPQLSLAGDFPDSWKGFNYRIDSEITNFVHRDNFYDVNRTPVVEGVRFGVSPSIELPLEWRGIYTAPKIELKTISYGLHDQPINHESNAITRFYPLMSLDSGMIFSRDLKALNSNYTQTLEPRILYLLVPSRDQSNVPIFDTYLPSFGYNQLFYTNRFAGIDRVGDANQIAVTLSSRILDDWGQEKINIGVGQIFAFRKHEIVIDGNNPYSAPYSVDPLEKNNLSPVAGYLRGFILPKTDASLDVAWDPNMGRFTTVNTNLRYSQDPKRVLNVWYNYALNGDQLFENQPTNLSRIGSSFGWKVWSKWNVIGNVNYNLSYRRPQSYLAGLEYSSCCWALRLVHTRNFIGVGANEESNYDSKIYLQFLLRGLGGMDVGGMGGLADHVVGYEDSFVTKNV